MRQRSFAGAFARRSTLHTNRRRRLRGECVGYPAATGAVAVEVAVLPVVAV
jgi:hypothetical protein